MNETQDFHDRINSIGPGDHVCMVYENRIDQMAAAIPFILNGLRKHECCFYIADDRTLDEVLAALQASGIDVAREQDKGALQLMTKREAYLRNATFDPSEMIDTLSRSTEDAVRAGFSGLRITGEMTWALGPETGCERLIEYEALLNRFFPGSRACAVCQYNRERFTPEVIRDVLRTHPTALLGKHVCSNLYYEPPEFLLNGGNAAERVEWMMMQLKRNEEAFTERRRAEQRLHEADRKKDEFLAILAHELRNPLAPIRNAAAILKAKNFEDPQVNWCRDVIDRQVHHMSRLLEDLLEVTRLTQGKLMLRKEEVELRIILSQALESCRPIIEERKHLLSVSFPESPVALNADPARLVQVFTNLIDNASKYTEPGGKLEIRVDLPEDFAEVRIRDNGIGMEPEHLVGLFQLFSQIDRGSNGSQEGLGIGLAISRGLIDLHGGSIEAASAGQGKGSEFVVRLPLPAATVMEGVSDTSDIQPIEGLKILVTDDNRDSADSLTMMLEVLGNQVKSAYSGEEALEILEKFDPDLILMDIGMPEMDGYEVARRIRKLGRDVILVAQTGWGQEEDRRKAAEAGFDYHLVKPIEVEALTSLLAERNQTLPS